MPFADFLLGRINSYLRGLVLVGHIRGGRAWFDPSQNADNALRAGRITISVEVALFDIAEQIVIRSSTTAAPAGLSAQLAAGGA